MGCFLFRRRGEGCASGGVCSFRSVLLSPAPLDAHHRTSPGTPCSGFINPSWQQINLSRVPRHDFTPMFHRPLWRCSLPRTGRLAAAHHHLTAHPPPPASVGGNAAANKFTGRSLPPCSIAELRAQSSQRGFPPVSPAAATWIKAIGRSDSQGPVPAGGWTRGQGQTPTRLPGAAAALARLLP